MANENLGASFSIDITNLKAGLAQANRLIRESESEFKAAAAGMDDWSASEEGLNERIKSLTSITGIQQKKVNALQQEYDRLVADGLDPASKEAVELRTKINNETAALNKNEQAISDATKKLSELGNESEEAADSTEETADATEEASKEFNGLKAAGSVAVKAITAVAAAAASAVTGFFALAESTREYRSSIAQLEHNAQNAGVAFDSVKDTLAEVGAITGDTDAAMEGMNMLLASGFETSQIDLVASALTGAATKFDGLKFESLAEGLQETLSTGAAAGPFSELIERSGKSVEDFNAGLANCTTEADRQRYAMEYLVQSGLVKANEAYKEQNKDLIEAAQAEQRMTDALAELGAIAEPIMTTLKNLASDLLEAITPFVSLMGEGLMGAMEGTAGAADTLAEGLGGVLTTLINTIVEMLPFLIETIVSLVPEIIPPLLRGISDAIPIILEVIGTLIPELISEILSQLPMLLSLILNSVKRIVFALSDALPQVVSAIMEVLPLLIENLLLSIPLLLSAAISLLMAIVDAIPVIITELVSALPGIINTLITVLLDSIPILLEAAISLLTAIVDAIPVIIEALVEALPLIIDGIINGLLEALPLLLDAAITLFFAIIDSIPIIVETLFSSMPEIIEAILTSLSEAIPNLFETAKELLGQIGEAIVQYAEEVPGKIGEIITSMVEGLEEGIETVKEVGSDIIRGLWEGISDMVGWIGEKIQGFGESVLGGIKDFFGIASPSRVMADEVGTNLALGIGEGFENSIGDVNRAISGAMQFDSPSINLGGFNASQGLASGSNGQVVVNNYNTFSQAHSRYELYRAQMQTEAAVKLALVTT